MRPAEENADQRVVDVRVKRSLETFHRPIEAVAGDDVGAGELHGANRFAEDVGIEWEIGVHVENEIFLRRGESGFQRAAELAILRMTDADDARIFVRGARDELRRVVGRGVIDDDDLVIV